MDVYLCSRRASAMFFVTTAPPVFHLSKNEPMKCLKRLARRRIREFCWSVPNFDFSIFPFRAVKLHVT